MQTKYEFHFDTIEELDVSPSDSTPLRPRFAKQKAQFDSLTQQGTDSRHRRGSRGANSSSKRPSRKRHKLSGR